MKAYLHEVESALREIKPHKKPSPWLAENYIGAGQSKLTYLNIKIPEVRKRYKEGFSFSHLPAKAQWKIWDHIWHHSNIFEVMLLPSYWASKRPIEELYLNRSILLQWLNRVDNWAHSDELSAHYSKLLEYSPETFLPVFQKWNSSQKPWFKRQSIVGILFYSRFRRKVPSYDTVIRLIEKHIDDDHYFVQKGVGWALRELWNVYPEKTFQFLKQNAGRIPAAGWTAATEKLSLKAKAQLSTIRQLLRDRRSRP